MNLNGVSSVLSSDGLPAILLQKDGRTLETLHIRPARTEHRSFILATWVRSYENQARLHGIPKETYARYESEIAESRWQDCWVVTDDDNFTVYAWVCGHDGCLWHCYVDPKLRRIRVATRLIQFACGELKEYARKWPYAAHARVNPYLLRAK